MGLENNILGISPSLRHPEVEFISRVVADITGDYACFDIERSIDERGVLLELSVDKAHLGRVIGRKGQTAQAMRSLLRALGLKNDAHYSLKIEERQPA